MAGSKQNVIDSLIIADQSKIENIEKSTAGYYGWTGTSVIFDELLKMFTKKDIQSQIHPITFNDFLQLVLVPETALCMIAEDWKGDFDLDKDYTALLYIYNDSIEFGKTVHEETIEPQIGGESF